MLFKSFVVIVYSCSLSCNKLTSVESVQSNVIAVDFGFHISVLELEV